MDKRVGGDELTSNANDILEPFPSLPVELVRWILEVAAREDKTTSLSLAHVSKAVQQWMMTIIYHTVVLRRSKQITAFHRTLKAETCVGAWVHHLFIESHVQHGVVIAEIIYACLGLEFLVTNVFLAENGFVDMPSHSCPAPWHVVLLVAELGARLPPLGHPLLRNITHLYLDFLSEPLSETVQSLPLLTHLGIAFWGDYEIMDYLPRVIHMLSSSSLVILILHAFYDGQPTKMLVGRSWYELSKIEDRRLLVGPGLHEHGHRKLGESGATIWDDAEMIYKDWRMLVDEW